MKIPMMMKSDKAAIQAALKTCNEIDRKAPRVVHIHTTLEMEYIEISESMLAEAKMHTDITIISEPAAFEFDAQDNLTVRRTE